MASTEPYLGSVELWPLDWAPDGWLICNGQLLNIVQFQALYALLGIRFGGDGRTTFAIPDLRGRVPVGMGQSQGTSNYALGQKGGLENVVLNSNQMPSHTHPASGTVSPKTSAGGRGAVKTPEANYMGPAATETLYGPAGTGCMGPDPVTVTVQPAGGNLPFSVLQPYIGMNYIIAITGVFPVRP